MTIARRRQDACDTIAPGRGRASIVWQASCLPSFLLMGRCVKRMITQVNRAFQQWLQSPAGQQAREKLDTADMSEQQILQSLFQHFVVNQE